MTTRILLAEDSKLIERTAIAQLNRQWDLLVDVARDGREALCSGVRSEYALILMDINMPEISGLAVARLIRRNHVETPIIGISADANAASCFSAGMDDFFKKPANYCHIVEKWLPHLAPRVSA